MSAETKRNESCWPAFLSPQSSRYHNHMPNLVHFWRKTLQVPLFSACILLLKSRSHTARHRSTLGTRLLAFEPHMLPPKQAISSSSLVPRRCSNDEKQGICSMQRLEALHSPLRLWQVSVEEMRTQLEFQIPVFSVCWKQGINYGLLSHKGEPSWSWQCCEAASLALQ